MSTRSVKKTTTRTTYTSSAGETSSVSTPGTSSTPRTSTATSTPSSTQSSRTKSSKSSPLSPTRISRLREKQDLQDLNNRLATYIDRVRHLETENSRLNVQIETIEESMKKEVSSHFSSYWYNQLVANSIVKLWSMYILADCVNLYLAVPVDWVG